jgi:hypothetical protein
LNDRLLQGVFRIVIQESSIHFRHVSCKGTFVCMLHQVRSFGPRVLVLGGTFVVNAYFCPVVYHGFQQMGGSMLSEHWSSSLDIFNMNLEGLYISVCTLLE